MHQYETSHFKPTGTPSDPKPIDPDAIDRWWERKPSPWYYLFLTALSNCILENLVFIALAIAIITAPVATIAYILTKKKSPTLPT